MVEVTNALQLSPQRQLRIVPLDLVKDVVADVGCRVGCFSLKVVNDLLP
jgi:hypothetical protein